MKPENLRKLHAELQALSRYCSTTNTITEEQARNTCKLFGYDFEDTDIQTNYLYANKCGQEQSTTAGLPGVGLHMFHNANRLFFGFLYDIAYENRCADEEYQRHHEYDE